MAGTGRVESNMHLLGSGMMVDPQRVRDIEDRQRVLETVRPPPKRKFGAVLADVETRAAVVPEAQEPPAKVKLGINNPWAKQVLEFCDESGASLKREKYVVRG